MTFVALLFSVLTLLSACGVVLSKRPLFSALFLTLTLFLVAVLFALIGAHFLAAIQVLVYAGAIMILVVFVIMLLGLDANTEEKTGGLSSFWGAVAAGVFLSVLGSVIVSGIAKLGPVDITDRVNGTTEAIGKSLFNDYLFAFEVTSLLILAGIVGAVVLGFESKRALRPGRGLKTKRNEIEQSVGGGV